MITPSQTVVKPFLKIQRSRMLPHAGEVTVSHGQLVTPVQVVARTSRQRGFTVIPAAEILGVPPEDVPQYLLVEEGTAIQRKKPLLRKPGLVNGRQLTSPVNGVLYDVNRGRLILQRTPELFELRALLPGRVISVRSGWGVIIETTGTLIQAAWGSGRENYGKIRVVTGDRDEPFRDEHIDADARGTILVAGRLDRRGALDKAGENSVRGVIAGSAPASLVPLLSDYRFPILITEGFAGQPMARSIFQLLQQSEEREASLFGDKEATQEKRPEIIIPLPAAEGADDLSPGPLKLESGQHVRVLRAPHAGEIGRVVTVHRHSQDSSIGLRLPGADILLASGQVVFVPYPNIDVIK